jgi:peptidoglycan hydrolase-like protein with peptidoglycan-binding domain
MRLISKDFNPANKKSVANLHALLEKLDTGDIPAAERRARRMGAGTRALLERAIGAALTRDGDGATLDPDTIDKLNARLLKARYADRAELGQMATTLAEMRRRGLIEATVPDPRQIGDARELAEALKAVQKRYKLPQTGAIDAATEERIGSVMAAIDAKPPERPRPLSKPPVTKLARTRKNLSLNKTGQAVADLQTDLAWLGFDIDATEHKEQRFGKSTRDAVRSFQLKNGLRVTDKVDTRTAKLLNARIERAKPDTAAVRHSVRGSVRNKLWQGISRARVQVCRVGLGGNVQVLEERQTFSNGFFDIRYVPPQVRKDNSGLRPVELLVRWVDDNDIVIDSATIRSDRQIAWANFTQGTAAYRGPSEWERRRAALKPILDEAGLDPRDLGITTARDDFRFISQETGYAAEDVLRYALAHRIAEEAPGNIAPEVWFGMIEQGLPPEVQAELFPEAPEDWAEHAPRLVTAMTNGLVLLEAGIQADALTASSEANLVPRAVAVALDDVLSDLAEVRVRAVLALPILVGNGRLDDLLEVAGIDAGGRKTVAGAVLKSHGITEAFWSTLAEDGLDAPASGQLRSVMDIGAITRNHIPAVKAMNTFMANPGSGIDDARGFAKLDQKGWTNLLKDEGVTAPDNIPGATAAERLETYAATLVERAAQIFPGTALVASLARSNEHALRRVDEISKFLDENPGFDLAKDRIEADIGRTALSERAIEEGKVIQRIHRMTSNVALGTALLDAKLHSGTQIYMRGKAQLVTDLKGGGIAEDDARALFARAEQQYATALAKLMIYRAGQFRDTPAALPVYKYSADEIAAIKSDIPDIETLFGSFDFCDCEHCASVYSPAAYLTDVLRFLDEKAAVAPGKTVLDVLKNRRPDIVNIKLDCANTNTPLPYIDLVNEILERAVPPADPNFTLQTTRPAAELRAVPEHVRATAYTALRGTEWPMPGIFNLWQSETRAFLAHLQVPRHALMEDLQDRSDAATTVASNTQVAAEFFGLSREETAFVIPAANPATVAVQNVVWGLDTASATVSVFDYLTAAGISYGDLLDLLQCAWVNPEAGKSVIERPFDDCDVRKQTITNMSAAKYARASRFLILWKRTGWQMWELDLMVRAPGIGNGTLDGAALFQLYKAASVARDLTLSATEVAAFFGPIDTQSRGKPGNAPVEPLYLRLFQNPAVTGELDPHFAMPLTAAPLNDHAATIKAALQISADDLTLLTPLTDGQTTPESLAVLFRYTRLARALRRPVADLLTFINATDTSDLFTSPQTLASTLGLLNETEAADFSIAEVAYLITAAPDSAVGIHQDTLVQQVETLRQSRAAMEADLNLSGDLVRDGLDRQLARLPSLAEPGVRTTALDLIQGTWAGTEPERAAFVAAHFATFIPLSADPAAVLTTLNLFDGDQLTEAEEAAIQTRSAFVAAHLRSFLTRSIVTDHIAAVTGLPSDVALVLQTGLTIPGPDITPGAAMVQPGLTETDADGDFATDATEVNFPTLFRAHRLLHKIGLLLDNLRLTADELDWILINHAALGMLDPAELPIDADPGASLFAPFIALLRAVAFRNRYPVPEGTSFLDLLDALDDSDVNAVWDIFGALTQKPSETFQVLGPLLGFNHGGGNGTNYRNPANWHRLRAALAHADRLGLSVTDMAAFRNRSNPAQDAALALAARQAAKAKYSAEDWLGKVTPLEDTLREAKRDALVSYLIERARRTEPETVNINGQIAPNSKRWQDQADLFSYYLIDVAMSACAMTSRIKQAILSVQLFVQRCLMNLEAREVQVPQDDPSLENSWTQWEWMANYRIWEANRKVFLYPENWIEPELRDDKTPFFRDLTNDLMQSEITADSAERAYAQYLDRLSDVANLKVVGLYHDYHSGRETMHILARTRSRPYRHYHRTYDIEMKTWSPWRAIDVEIETDHALPVVYNRKLHIFWLSIERKPIKLVKNPPANASDTTSDNPEPMKMMEIRLGWTVLGHDGWAPTKQSDLMLIHPWERPASAYHLQPRYITSDNSLWIDLYCSSTEDFNNSRFYQQHKGKKEYQTGTRFRETLRPWHSSSFVFDGDVRAAKMHGIRALYPVPNADRTAYTMRYTSSYDYVSNNFGEDGRRIEPLLRRDRARRLPQPAGMHYEFNRLADNKVLTGTIGRLSAMTTGLSTSVILSGADRPFEAVVPMQPPANRPLVFQDQKRSFFVKQEWVSILADYQTRETISRYVAQPLYHPYAALFVQELARDGVDGLLNRRIQVEPETMTPRNSFDFDTIYQPVAPHTAVSSAKKDVVDFSFDGAFSVYNWELFFHVPIYIANRLSQNQRFEDAQRWYHFIFDPTNIENLPTPARYWITKPLHEQTTADYRAQRIQNLIDRIEEFSDQVTAWKNDPFKPHLIARYRPVAFQRNVVMKYLDNLIAWADQLFRRDTLESINQASLLYALAGEILGRRPETVPGVVRDAKSFEELSQNDGLDIFGNALVEVQAESQSGLPVRIVPAESGTEALPRLEIGYFCIPRNDKLMEYWSVIEDRLSKIRTCRNIDGIVRQLPLFAPPIDPALLVKAAASGVDLSSALTALSVGTPIYRFQVLVAVAERMALQVKQLGDGLQRILETKDAEALSALRASQEVMVQDMLRASRQQEIDETDAEIESLDFSWQALEERRTHLAELPQTTDLEQFASDLVWGANLPLAIAAGLNTFGAIVSLIPSFNFGGSGVGGSPHVTASWGGGNLAGSASQFAAVAQAFIQQAMMNAGEIEKSSHRLRSFNDNQMQVRVAVQQQLEVDRRKLAAQIRRAVRENELQIQETRWDNAKTEEAFLSTKYTNAQLYDWMLGQASAVYFQAYQTAFDMAQRAERSFRHEMGIEVSSYIQFGYWDALRKGLQSGEKLLNDIHLMEAAYFDRNKREYELTKHISLAELAPGQLLQLKLTGQCSFDLPEWMFDMDYPGHHMRRIKSVAFSFPCVVGPYSGVHCTAALTASRIRVSPLVGAGYAETGPEDIRFRHFVGTAQSIATSHGQSDDGLFQLNLGDDRFLPFEGLGAIGTWSLKMPHADNRFDFSTISDVVMHLRYTARPAGGNLEIAARDHLAATLPDMGVALYALRSDFGDAWHRFLNAPPGQPDRAVVIEMSDKHFPFRTRSASNLDITGLDVFIDGDHAGAYLFEVQLPGQSAFVELSAAPDASLNGAHHVSHTLASATTGRGQWRMRLRRDSDATVADMPPDGARDVMLVIRFEAS